MTKPKICVHTDESTPEPEPADYEWGKKVDILALYSSRFLQFQNLVSTLSAAVAQEIALQKDVAVANLN